MTEHSLHTDIISWYSIEGDKFEVKIDDFVIDLVRDELLIEIQTRNLSAIKKKLAKLLLAHRVRLVYPIAKVKWILYQSQQGEITRKRKSPKKGCLFDLFSELVYVADLFNERNFSFVVLFTEDEEIRCNDGKGSWRRRGISIKDRRLLKIYDKVLFKSREDFLSFLPSDLSSSFTICLGVSRSRSIFMPIPRLRFLSSYRCRFQRRS